jgi:hypothetical protein
LEREREGAGKELGRSWEGVRREPGRRGKELGREGRGQDRV